MTPPPDPDRAGPNDPARPAGASALPPALRWLAGGCLGVLVFYLAAFALAIAGARLGRPGYALIALLLAGVVGAVLRAGGRRGRALVASMAVGAAVAALVGGALLRAARFQ